MSVTGKTGEGVGLTGWRLLIWGGAATLLLLPAVAMRFTPEVNWTAGDFAVFGAMLALAGGAAELLIRRSASLAYRIGGALLVGSAFVIVWANLAVGMIGSEDNRYNLLFALPILAAAAGAVMVRGAAAGLVRVAMLAGVAQLLIAAGGAVADPRGARFSAVLALGWLLAAALFARAARTRTGSA